MLSILAYVCIIDPETEWPDDDYQLRNCTINRGHIHGELNVIKHPGPQQIWSAMEDDCFKLHFKENNFRYGFYVPDTSSPLFTWQYIKIVGNGLVM